MLDLDASICPGCQVPLPHVPLVSFEDVPDWEDWPPSVLYTYPHAGGEVSHSFRCVCGWAADSNGSPPTLRTLTPPAVLVEMERLRARIAELEATAIDPQFQPPGPAVTLTHADLAQLRLVAQEALARAVDGWPKMVVAPRDVLELVRLAEIGLVAEATQAERDGHE